MMQIKGSSGSRRQVARISPPRDTRPIIGMYDVPAWQRRLERLAPIGCVLVAIATLAIGIYAYAGDYIDGLLR